MCRKTHKSVRQTPNKKPIRAIITKPMIVPLEKMLANPTMSVCSAVEKSDIILGISMAAVAEGMALGAKGRQRQKKGL
ncbi:MAG: hypothetical protein RR540_07845 [Oscillospiraceae bacterium]